MARSDADHFRLLNRWPLVMQADPWNFNQLVGAVAPLSTESRVIYIQRERDMIADALNNAAQMIADQLGFYPRPVWLSERLHVGRGWQELQTHRLTWGYVQEFGVRTTSLIQAGVAVVYSDTNADGTDDLATITVVTGVAASEIGVFFQVADGAESAGASTWEIEPLSVSVSGGVATITGPRYLFVKPSVVWAQEFITPNFTDKSAGNTSQPNDFVTAVDIYRVYSDTTSFPAIQSDPIFCSACGSNLGGNTTTLATGRIYDSRLGIVQVRPTSCCSACGYWPETIDVYYKAGFPLENGKMARRLELACIRLANTLMPQQPETFINPVLGMWQQDRVRADVNTLTQGDMHPFGDTMVGRIDVWRNIKHMALGQGGKVTSAWA